MSIKPFEIAVPDSALQTLNQKLSLATFPDELDQAGWDMGPPLADVKRLTARWKDGFDWRAKERELNKNLHQYIVPVPVKGFGEVDVHFVHQRSEVKSAVPLLFIHGCMSSPQFRSGLRDRIGPGSFLEATKLLPLLTKADENGQKPAFHVVVPSLPNYGFSEGIKKVSCCQPF